MLLLYKINPQNFFNILNKKLALIHLFLLENQWQIEVSISYFKKTVILHLQTCYKKRQKCHHLKDNEKLISLNLKFDKKWNP